MLAPFSIAMHQLPPPILTRRLALRALDTGDADALLDLYRDADVMRYWNQAPWSTIDQALATVAEAQADDASGAALQLAIVQRAGGAVIGHCALYAMAPDRRRASLGYLLVPAHWGQGYAREALAALLAHGFAARGLLRIDAEVDPGNAASAAVLARLGFRRRPRVRRRWNVAGSLREVDLHVLRPAWFTPS